MLVIPTELRLSPLHGLGVFTVEPLRKGQLIIRHRPVFDLVFPPEVFASLPPAFCEAVEYYGYKDQASGSFAYDVDNGRFINHSEEPNLKCGQRIMKAARDIAAGEELLADYREFCDECKDRGVAEVFREARSFVDLASLNKPL